jgi:hypothetical protein
LCCATGWRVGCQKSVPPANRHLARGGHEFWYPTPQGRESSQRLGRSAGREHFAVADQMPRVEAQLWIHPPEQLLALFALDRDGPQALRAIPGEDLVERPLAETAVLVVEDEALGLSRHPGASRGAKTCAAAARRSQVTTTGQLTNTIKTVSHCAE